MSEALLEPSAASVPFDDYWNGPPPPYAAAPPLRPPFWSRLGVWVAVALAVILLTGAYFLLTGAGDASAAGGCGGG